MKIVSAEKKLVDQVIDECTETIEEVELAKITLALNLVLAKKQRLGKYTNGRSLANNY